MTATAVTSSLVHLFPYHNDSQGLKIVAVVIFLMGLTVFFFNAACIIAKAILYPKVRLAQSMLMFALIVRIGST